MSKGRKKEKEVIEFLFESFHLCNGPHWGMHIRMGRNMEWGSWHTYYNLYTHAAWFRNLNNVQSVFTSQGRDDDDAYYFRNMSGLEDIASRGQLTNLVKVKGLFFLSKIGDLNETDFAESGRKGILPHSFTIKMCQWPYGRERVNHRYRVIFDLTTSVLVASI